MNILFVYANTTGSYMAPLGIAALHTYCKIWNHNTFLFDTTIYQLTKNANKSRVEAGTAEVYPDDILAAGAQDRMIENLKSTILNNNVDVVAISTVEDTFYIAQTVYNTVQISCKHIPVVIGGVFPTFASDLVHKLMPEAFIVKGEGEFSFVDLIANGFKNQITEPTSLIDINNQTIMDYSIFPEYMFNRPMQGLVRKTISIEVQRGCPYGCEFCNSKSQNVMYNKIGQRFFRKKSIQKIDRELSEYIKLYNPEFIYWVGDSFLSMADKEWSEFCDMYSHYKLPFWMNTRPETITKSKVKQLRDIGCLRCNIGVEHGNEAFRKQIIGRNYTNQQILYACSCFKDSGITLITNSIIGFPTETLSLIYDTIKLNNEMMKQGALPSVFIFAPYHGTALRKLCETMGLIDEGTIITDGMLSNSYLDQQQLPKVFLPFFQKYFKELVGSI